ncbi:MAG: peptidoglycan-N-acetylglucosamine deacetylase, partial [Cyanobacteria bacterium J06648_11]
ELRSSVDETHDILSEFGEVRWFRPASGWYSRTVLDVAKQHDYQTALGSVFPFDTHIRSVDFAVWYVLGNVRPGAIVVLHDGGDRGSRTAATLERVLPALSDRGYQVTSLSEAIAHRNP